MGSKRMRTSRDVIDRFFHDATFDTEQVSVGYLDRCAGGLVERPLSAFFLGDISSVGPDVLAIPQHRIHYFAYEGERVWDKTSGLDRIFGSTGAKRLLADELLERPAPEVAEAVPQEAVPLEVVPSPEITWATSASSRNAESAARPNAFFCVPVHDPAVLRTAAEVQAALAASEPRVDLRVRGALTPLSSLHITLGTCRIESEHERRVAVAIAAESAQRLHELVTEPLRLSGVRGFRDRVLYGAVAAPGATALTQVADELRGALDAAGLAAGNHEEFTAHMTLVKLPRALCREIGTLDTNSWWGMRDVDFGAQGVAGLHLCWMRTPGGPPPGATAHGGFYDTIASARFGRLVPQASRPARPRRRRERCASRSPTRRRRAARSRSRSRRCATSCSRWEATPTWRSRCGGFEN